MGPERRRKITTFLQIGLLAGALTCVAHQAYLARLRSDFERCTETYSVGDESVISYAENCEYNTFQRGVIFRPEPVSPALLLPEQVTITGTQNDCEGDISHDMYHQVGPTCYLTCLAAAISDLSGQNNGPAVDPLYLSDMVALEGMWFSPEKAQSLEDINITTSEIDEIDNVDLGNGFVFEIKPNLLEDFKQEGGTSPDDLSLYIESLISEPNVRLVYSSSVDEGIRHAVLVLDVRLDEDTGVPYLFVAEPNGGGIENWSKNASWIKDTWSTVSPTQEFLTRIDITDKTMKLVTGLTSVRLVSNE